jgi:hypothetical protein
VGAFTGVSPMTGFRVWTPAGFGVGVDVHQQNTYEWWEFEIEGVLGLCLGGVSGVFGG